MTDNVIEFSSPRHQQAALWAAQLDEQLYWMESDERERFFEAVTEVIKQAWSPSRLASAIAWDDQLFAEDLISEIEEILGEDQ